MKKIMITMATVCVVGLGSTGFSDSVQASTTDDLHSKQSQVQNERSEIKANLSDAESEIADILIDLNEINEEIARVEETLKANQKAMDETKEEMDTFESEIEKLEKAIEERFDILKQRAKSYQRSGGNIGYLDVILGSKNFGEFISRVSAVTKIADSDSELIKKQEEDKEKVENKLADLNELKVELESIEALITEQKEENEQKKSDIKLKEKELNSVLSELKMKDSKLAALEKKINQSITIENNPVVGNTESSDSSNAGASKAVVSGNGKLSWPTSGGYISSHLGMRNGRMHKGIDIARTDRSTSPPIYAADGGVVISAGYSGAYGNRVIINHKNGMKTTYSHLSSISVSAGQSVSSGSKLGVMGTTGSSTGIHLHFEVYVNGSLKNPMGYF